MPVAGMEGGDSTGIRKKKMSGNEKGGAGSGGSRKHVVRRGGCEQPSLLLTFPACSHFPQVPPPNAHDSQMELQTHRALGQGRGAPEARVPCAQVCTCPAKPTVAEAMFSAGGPPRPHAQLTGGASVAGRWRSCWRTGHTTVGAPWPWGTALRGAGNQPQLLFWALGTRWRPRCAEPPPPPAPQQECL